MKQSPDRAAPVSWKIASSYTALAPGERARINRFGPRGAPPR